MMQNIPRTKSEFKLWLEKHHVKIRRIVVLKTAVASGLIVAHYFPGHVGLLTNLAWLILF